MEPVFIAQDGREFLHHTSTIYVNGDQIVKRPINGVVAEFNRGQFFHLLAPMYSPGPVYRFKAGGIPYLLMNHAGEPIDPCTTDKLERTIGFLQTLHCMMLVDGKMGMHDMRPWHLLKTNKGADVQFRFAHVGSWIIAKGPESRDGLWRSNARMVERLWAEIGMREYDIKHSIHKKMQCLYYEYDAEDSAEQVADAFIGCAKCAIKDYTRKYGKDKKPPQMDTLYKEMRNIRACMGKIIPKRTPVEGGMMLEFPDGIQQFLHK